MISPIKIILFALSLISLNLSANSTYAQTASSTLEKTDKNTATSTTKKATKQAAKTTKKVKKIKNVKSSNASTPEYVINLESTITGDKEQPAVSYFIPWQKVGTPDKLRWDMDQKHDDSLETVDRDVMVRSMTIYQQMNIENTTGH